MRNTRPTMEDRITAFGSFLDVKTKKTALLTLSDDVTSEGDEDNELLPPPPPMIGGEHFIQASE